MPFVPLDHRQAGIAAFVGIALFLAAALLIRALQPLDPFTDPTRILVYALVLVLREAVDQAETAAAA